MSAARDGKRSHSVLVAALALAVECVWALYILIAYVVVN